MIPMDRFTRHAQEAMARTQTIARELGHSTVEPEHLLVALLEQSSGPVPQALSSINIDPTTSAAAIRELLSKQARQPVGDQMYLSRRGRRVMEGAVFAANQYIGQMWTADESQLNSYSSGALKGQPYLDFADQLKTAQGGAWSVDPTVTFDCIPAPSATSRAVCIVIKWKICADSTNPACNTANVDVHNFTTSAVIGQNQW